MTHLRYGRIDISITPVDPETQNRIELSQWNKDTQRVLSLAQS
jgi:hypothetical protein